jgi:hypothetical protein
MQLSIFVSKKASREVALDSERKLDQEELVEGSHDVREKITLSRRYRRSLNLQEHGVTNIPLNWLLGRNQTTGFLTVVLPASRDCVNSCDARESFWLVLPIRNRDRLLL